MAKLELIKNLQQTLKEMKNARAKLDEDIELFRNNSSNGEFFSESLGEKIREQLECVLKLQKDFSEKYCEIDENCEGAQIYILEEKLSALQKKEEEKSKYKEAVSFFMNLSSESAEVAKILGKKKSDLEKVKIEESDREMLEREIGPYLMLLEAYKESDERSKFKLMYKLASYFEEEILEEIQFKTILVEEKAETENVSEIVQEIEDESESADTEEVESEVTVTEEIEGETAVIEEAESENEIVVAEETESENETVVTEEAEHEIEIAVMEEIEDENEASVTEEDSSRYQELMVKEIPSDLRVLKSSKSDARFSVEKFKKIIFKQFIKEKIACLVEALDSCGYTIESVAVEKGLKTENLEHATEKLYMQGYLNKYIVTGMGAFYVLSSRGEKIFQTKESLGFINRCIKNKVSGLNEKGEKIKDTADSAMARILALETVKKQTEFVPDYKFEVSYSHLGTDHFIRGYSDFDEKETNWFAGIVTENPEEFKELAEMLKGQVKEKDTLIVTGRTVEDAKKVAEWLGEELDEVHPKQIWYYGYDTKGAFDLNADEEIEVDFSEPELEKTDEKIELESESDVEHSEEKIEPEEIPEEPEMPEESEIPEEPESPEKPEVLELKIAPKQHKSLSEEDKSALKRNYEEMLKNKKFYIASAYLKALSKDIPEYESVYQQLAYAVNDPLENCTYNSDTLFNVYYYDGAPISDYYVISATLRNYFLDQFSYDYSLQQLQSMLVENRILAKNPVLEEIIYTLMEFKKKHNRGLDRYADYRAKERADWERTLEEIKREARQYYENFSSGNFKESASHRRFIETEKLLLKDLCEYLRIVKEDDREFLEVLEDYLRETFIKNDAEISEENLDTEKLNKVLTEYWELAAQNLNSVKRTSDLMSSLRMNLYKKESKIVNILCRYVSLMKSSTTDAQDAVFGEYKKLRTVLLEKISDVIVQLETVQEDNLEESSGKAVLAETLSELKERLEGTYQEGRYKYYYVGFLRNDKVLLDENFMPILDDVLELPEFSTALRIMKHYSEPEKEWKERLDEIFCGEDDYGEAELILEYVNRWNIEPEDFSEEKYNVEKAVEFVEKDAENKKEEFIADVELAQSYGQINNVVEDSKEIMIQIMESWYKWCADTKNYGFFAKILEAFKEKIKKDAQERAVDLQKNLAVYLEKNPLWKEEKEIAKAVGQIKERIEQQNYAAAEDLLNRIMTNDLNWDFDFESEDFLEDFWDEYGSIYSKTAKPGVTLKVLADNSKFLTNKDTKGGKRLIEHWPKGITNVSAEILKELLISLGFPVECITEELSVNEKIKNFFVVLKTPLNGRKSNYKHPISVFGSEAEKNGFRVVCLFGKTDADRLVDTFKEIGNARNTLVILDYALTQSDRRTLARKAKMHTTGKVFAVIDRVALSYLAKHYNETAINRMLMSIIMPFASYQPYVVNSGDVMPPEMFIGRKFELQKIEEAKGVNLVYGGRQLGKSALLKMARKDIDKNENGDRAILVDIKYLDYKAAAKKVSETLYDEGVFKEEYTTDDWHELARNIKKRLNDKEDPIPYFLLMLDEGDAFIESCEAIRYQPFDELKDIQSIGEKRFKFVVAGLRNIIRYKRKAALENNSVLPQLQSLTVKPFKVIEARELLEIPLSYLGFRFPKDNETEVLVSTIFGTTNYFPGLIQLYCQKLIEAVQRDYANYTEDSTPPYLVQKDLVKKVLADKTLLQEIKKKFDITLGVGDDDYYNIIALLVAYHYYQEKSQNGCSVDDVKEIANGFYIKKIATLDTEKISALMEEMRELNVLQYTEDGRYRFTRYNFCQMMGTIQEINDKLEKYMED